MKKGVVTGAAICLAAGAVLAWTWAGDDPPPERAAGQAGAAAGAALVEVALPDELSPEARIGRRAFEARCATCHGENAAGREGAGPPLVHRIYEPGHHGDMAFVLAAKNGVRAHHWNFGSMPPVEGLTEADVRSIARYVRELQETNGIF